MGKIQILTPEQKSILAGVGENQLLRKNFYFTGGTALAQFYLQHRLSEDLDFFSQQELDKEYLFAQMQKWRKKYHFSMESRFNEVVYSFNLTFPNNDKFKVDFGHYPYKLLEKGQDSDGLMIDSFKDIAVNKFLTVNQRTSVKDFVDLYFLLKKGFTIWDLIYGKEAKFKMETETLLLAEDFLKVDEFETLPRMIKPLTLQELKAFFRKKAIEVGRKAIIT